MAAESVLDVVTVIHNERNYAQSLDLEAALVEHADLPYSFWRVDNRVENRGFGPGCNFGAAHGTAPVIGLLNPDVVVKGPFMRQVVETLVDPVVITGERFDKADWEIRRWGCRAWVCGAALFADRAWWESVGGFDEAFKWGWEESALIRLAQRQEKLVRSIRLPLEHRSPDVDSPEDVAYKHEHFEAGARLFEQKWGWGL